MKLTTLAACFVLPLITGCAFSRAPLTGFLYTNVKSDGQATEAYGGSARGEACASSVLGAFATGDASIDTAKKNGGVVQVTAVDHTATSYLVYAKYCTIVYGKKGSGAVAPPPGSPNKPAEGGG